MLYSKMMMNSNSTTSKSQKKSTLIFWIESNSTYSTERRRRSWHLFFWQFYWVSFLLPQQSHCVKKMVDFWTYDPTPDQPIPPPLPVMPHLAISALKTTQNYGVWSFFFTWEWIINTTIMALTTIHNLVYKQLLWSIFPPQNAGGSLTSFFWTTCFFGFGNILNTYLKKYNNAAPLTLKYPHTSPTNSLGSFYLCVIFICNSYIFQKVHKLHMKVIHNQKREGN